jgi:hypothetical protein
MREDPRPVVIDHAGPFRFRVVAEEEDGERYFGSRWTFWSAQRLARSAQRQLASGEDRAA